MLGLRNLAKPLGCCAASWGIQGEGSRPISLALCASWVAAYGLAGLLNGPDVVLIWGSAKVGWNQAQIGPTMDFKKAWA